MSLQWDKTGLGEMYMGLRWIFLLVAYELFTLTLVAFEVAVMVMYEMVTIVVAFWCWYKRQRYQLLVETFVDRQGLNFATCWRTIPKKWLLLVFEVEWYYRDNISMSSFCGICMKVSFAFENEMNATVLGSIYCIYASQGQDLALSDSRQRSRGTVLTMVNMK